MKLKLIWEIQPKPTGRYRSFSKRAWPMAYFDKLKNKAAVQIRCTDSYDIERAKSGNHAPLKVWIADYSVTPWEWRKLKAVCNTLEEAKQLAIKAFEKYAHYIPKEELS